MMTGRTLWTRTAKDIECGIHSNIPVCCIGYYVTCWQSITPAGRARYFAAADRVTDKHKRPRAQYVPCPDCLFREAAGTPCFVPIKPCTCALDTRVVTRQNPKRFTET